MNPIGDEAGKTARTLIDALKTTPAMLAMVLFNLAFIASIVWIQHQNGQRWERLLTETLKSCGKADAVGNDVLIQRFDWDEPTELRR